MYQNQATVINIVHDTPVYKLQLSETDILTMLCEGFFYCKLYFKTSKHARGPKEQDEGTAVCSGAGKSMGYRWREAPARQKLERSESSRW